MLILFCLLSQGDGRAPDWQRSYPSVFYTLQEYAGGELYTCHVFQPILELGLFPGFQDCKTFTEESSGQLRVSVYSRLFFQVRVVRRRGATVVLFHYVKAFIF